MANKQIFITGCAGFIGFHTAQRALLNGGSVAGIDNYNSYYDVNLKRARAEILQKKGVIIAEGDICDSSLLEKSILNHQTTHLIHLAAQAGVRYSLENPQAYVHSNLAGFTEVLEIVRRHPKIKLCFASSSSVYGLNSKIPYSIDDPTDHQASFYGTTKKANELMADVYRHLYQIHAVGLRFFTVYGPWGRPDMAYFSFADAISEGRSIDIYNFGQMSRDFTYVDDVVSGILAALDYEGKIPLFNLGNSQPVSLLKFVDIVEKELGKKAEKRLLPLQPGDISQTFADIKESREFLSYAPETSLEVGMKQFVNWYKDWKRFAKGGT